MPIFGWMDGPMPRITTFLGSVPVMMKPPMPTLFPLSTRSRVAIFSITAFVVMALTAGLILILPRESVTRRMAKKELPGCV